MMESSLSSLSSLSSEDDSTSSLCSEESSFCSEEELSSSADEEEEEVMCGKWRFVRERVNPFVIYNDIDFREKFRIRKDVAMRVLDKFGKDIAPVTHRSKSIDAATQLLVTLRFYATGALQNSISDNVQMSQSSASRIIQRVTQHIVDMSQTEIAMPSGSEIDQVCADFYKIQEFPRVVGAVGCTHIKILSPGGEKARLYRKKGSSSINIQAVCDAHLKIRHLIAHCPGATPNAKIMMEGSLPREMESGQFGVENYLLGDNGYPCKKFLLTPVINPKSPAEEAYNAAHKATHSAIVRCFTDLKSRFPCLTSSLRTKFNTTTAVIVACAVLHNIAIDHGDFEEEEEPIIEEVKYKKVDTKGSDTSKRDFVIKTFFTKE